MRPLVGILVYGHHSLELMDVQLESTLKFIYIFTYVYLRVFFPV